LDKLAVHFHLRRAPGEKIKSLIFGAARNIVAMSTGVATGAVAAAAVVGTATGTSMALPPVSRPKWGLDACG